MKAGIFFTGTGPILILTTYDSLGDPRLVEKLNAKGIKKFIAYEVSPDLVRKKYGGHYSVVIHDLKQTDDCRVLDMNGHSVFYNFSFKEMTNPVYFESETAV